MSKMIQVRNVPDELHRQLKARAAMEGQTLSDYFLSLARRAVQKPTLAEMVERLKQREPVQEPIDAAAWVRAERDSR